jgi:hypothetical protein
LAGWGADELLTVEIAVSNPTDPIYDDLSQVSQPILVGELVAFRAAINYAGRTSMVVAYGLKPRTSAAERVVTHEFILLYYGRGGR